MAPLPVWTNFVIAAAGGTSGWMFVHPFDVLKVRLQINESKSISPLKAMAGIFREEGIRGLYSGLSAAVTRQCTYTTLRMGLYDTFRNKLSPGTAKSNLPLWKKLVCGLGSGATAASMCCPVEVALVRMQADGSVPVDQRRGYRNVVDAIFRVAREEGVATLWRGVGPTVVRGMVVSATQLGTYDQAKEVLEEAAGLSGVPLHLSSSLVSGFVYCVASLPLDICKTRMQNQKPVNGVLPYTSIPQTLVKIPTQEGVLALWKGFPPYFARGGGHTIGMFVFVEQYRALAHQLLD